MLLICYGNQGRGDDGLGPALAMRLEARRLEGLTIEVDYQLSVEHALMISEVDRVVFADASITGTQPFSFEKIEAGEAASLGSHSLTPRSVLSLALTLYGRAPDAFLLGIAGQVFGDVREGLSAGAIANLDRAEAFFVDWYGKLGGTALR
jgi:hydrogenase maturation protease